MATFVYMITRSDGLKYIGITTDVGRRIREHRKTKRFESGIDSCEILAECATYSEAESLEEEFISAYDTYASGLNLTRTGKGKSDTEKFNTYGHRHSDRSRQKMRDSHWTKRGGRTWNAGRTDAFSEETKKRWSAIRSGKCWGKRTIDPTTAEEIQNAFKTDSIDFDLQFLKKLVKKSQASDIDNLQLNELVSPNGKPLTKTAIYSYYFADKYNVTPAAIRNIITGKTKMAVGYNE